MGSYDLSCSLSDLSIGYTSKAYFVILIPNRMFFGLSSQIKRSDFNQKMKPSSGYTYYNDLYVPFTLPIKGTYDTYGSLEDIEENEHTKYLEKYFDAKIEDIVKAITRNQYEKITNSHNPLFKKYNNKNLIKELSSYREEITPSILKKMGFIKSKDGTFSKKDINFDIELNKTKEKYFSILRDNKEIYSSSHRSFDDFLKITFEQTGVHLSIQKKYREQAKLINGLSGMFVLGNVYEKFINKSREYNSYSWISEDFLLNSGFVKGKKEDSFHCPDNNRFYLTLGYDRNNVYINDSKDEYFYENVKSVKELSDLWEKYTGQIYDVSSYKLKETHFTTNYRNKTKEFKKCKQLMAKLQKEKKEIPYEIMSKGFRIGEVLGRDLLPKFSENYAFMNFLQPLMEEGKVCKEVEDFQVICGVFSDNNKMLVPKHCGEQHGEYKKHKEFYTVIQEVIDDVIKKRKEDY